jgi:3-oxoacyl-[acyl-carrier-protein] synthase II
MNHVKEEPIRYAMSNSFGFGGTNASLLFKKFHPNNDESP